MTVATVKKIIMRSYPALDKSNFLSAIVVAFSSLLLLFGNSSGAAICEEQPDISNSQVEVINVHQNPDAVLDTFLEGDWIQYKCADSNRIMSPGSGILRCTADGWQPPSVICLLQGGGAACPEAATPQNAITVKKNATHVQFRCSDGYTLEGVAWIICDVSAKTWSIGPTCSKTSTQRTIRTPSTITQAPRPCRKPPNSEGLVNIGQSNSANNFGEGDWIVYRCSDSGQVMEGSEKITCTNGRWSDAPKCKIVCNPPRTPKNGKIIKTSGNDLTIPNSWIQFACNPGYVMSPPILRTVCDASGEWSQIPSCIRSTITTTRRLTKKPDVYCESQPDVGNEGLEVASINVNPEVELDIFSEGDSITYRCTNLNARMQGNATVYCTGSGTWTPSVPKCTLEPIRCPAPQAPSNGRLTGQTNLAAKVVCNEGFSISGDVTRILCDPTTGRWTTTPSCVGNVFCVKPTVPANAIVDKRSNSNAARYPVGSWLLFKCNPDYNIQGEANVSCTASGTWQSFPSCAKAPRLSPCNWPLIPEDGDIAQQSTNVDLSSDYIPAGSWVSFRCDGSEFEILGPTNVSCNGNTGQLEPPGVTVCKRQLNGCPKPQTPANARIAFSFPISTPSRTSYPHGGRIRYECDSGFVAVGSVTVLCNSDNKWNSDPPRCVRS